MQNAAVRILKELSKAVWETMDGSGSLSNGPIGGLRRSYVSDFRVS